MSGGRSTLAKCIYGEPLAYPQLHAFFVWGNQMASLRSAARCGSTVRKFVQLISELLCSTIITMRLVVVAFAWWCTFVGAVGVCSCKVACTLCYGVTCSKVNRTRRAVLSCLCGGTVALNFLVPFNLPSFLLYGVVVGAVWKRSGEYHPKTRDFSRPSKVRAPLSLPEAVGGSAQPMRPFSFFGSAVVEVAKESVQARKKGGGAGAD